MANFVRMTLLAALVAGIAGCSTEPTQAVQPAAADQALDSKVTTDVVKAVGKAGGTVTRTEQVTAKVIEIDQAKREFVVQDAAGHKRRIQAAPEMVNFPQLAVGDTVQATVMVETVVFLSDAKSAPTSDAELLAASADEGQKPGMLVAARQTITAKVTAIDTKARTATLLFEDGLSRVVPVREDVKLSADQVGKQVVIVETVAVAAEVFKL